MKINDRKTSCIKFEVYDGLTEQKFGCRKNFETSHSNNTYDLPDRIYFSHTQELREIIELLSDMYENIMKYRDKQEVIREELKDRLK